MRSLCAALSLIGVLAWADHALACGATAQPYLTVSAVDAGAQGELLPRDGAILIELMEWDVGQDVPVEVSAQVSLESSGELVPGTLLPWYTRPTPAFVWRPDAPLEANTSYVVEVVSAQAPRAEIDAPTSYSASFSTSDQLAPALELANGLRVTLRVGTATAYDPTCWNSCGGPCGPIGERPALYADVELPVVTGGFDRHGYSAWLALTDDTPQVFAGPGEGAATGSHVVELLHFEALAAGEAKTVTLEIPAEDVAYRPCFAFNAWDTAGHAISAEASCLRPLRVDALLAGEEDAAASDADADAGTDDADAAIEGDAAVPRDDNADSDASAVARSQTIDSSARADSAGGCAIASTGAATHRQRRTMPMLLIFVLALGTRMSSALHRRRTRA